MEAGKLLGALVLGAIAVTLFLGLSRQGPQQTALATILSKGYLSGSTYVQQPVGADRGFTTPTDVPIAESNVFELRVDGIAQPVRASFNTVKSRQFGVGQRVRVRYVRRGLPPLWTKIVVTDMTPADSA